MDKTITIHQLSEQLGLTSRTLRHWESEGLFASMRDRESGWRVYDNNSVMRVQITVLLRKLDIPIKDIKEVLDKGTYGAIYGVIEDRIALLNSERNENLIKENQLNKFLSVLKNNSDEAIKNITIKELTHMLESEQDILPEKENVGMQQQEGDHLTVRYIQLEPMRVIYHIAVSNSPEDEAMKPVVEWLKSTNLLSTARLFGGNVKPFPSKEGKPYGYGMCASIPNEIMIPPHLNEMTLPGGLYAMTESSDNIYESWQTLMKFLERSTEYESDHKSRMCFEEHIRNDKNNGEEDGNQYYINLLEPIKKRKISK